jgi:hypothetical protein
VVLASHVEKLSNITPAPRVGNAVAGKVGDGTGDAVGAGPDVGAGPCVGVGPGAPENPLSFSLLPPVG